MTYHHKLGNQLERTERVQLLAGRIARALGGDPAPTERAAWLAKADLLTGMVGEFPELQGTMGRYYALADDEDARVADAIQQHYRPRFSGDALPENDIAVALALADKLESLAGMFGIGQQPTGDKDPFALRRHALGVIRILTEKELAISVHDLVTDAFASFPPKMLGDARGNVVLVPWDERVWPRCSSGRAAARPVDQLTALSSRFSSLTSSRIRAASSNRRSLAASAISSCRVWMSRPSSTVSP